ncbi:RNA polymerase sigma factor [Enterococcus sp. LJL99]
MGETTQQLLVKQAKKGDAHAFIQLCEKYQNVLYNSAYKILQNNEDVADCLQETEINAWQNIKQLKNEKAFNSWIFKIMLNNAKDRLKKKIDFIELEEQFIASETNTYNQENLNSEFQNLSERYRIPIILYYYAGFSMKEIADQLDIPLNTVKTRLSRGRNLLKISLEGELDD